MDRTLKQYSEGYLSYAINDVGQLVSVDSVPTGIDCRCYCPSCKEPLVAKNKGLKRRHHFAHQSGRECTYAVESMLHILAKEEIREAFLSKPEFWIKFKYNSFCSHYNNCAFRDEEKCFSSRVRRFDLKKFYDSCEQEMSYDNIARRSDLKIFSSTIPNRKPIYFEFCVTHSSDSEKLHSGNKIIEIGIENEEDISNIIEYGVCESTINHSKSDISVGNTPSKICFYGFDNKDFKNENKSIEIVYERYILYKSGKVWNGLRRGNCKKICKCNSTSLLEIIHTIALFNIYDYVKYLGFKKFGIKNCVLCVNYVNSYDGSGRICRMYKCLHIPRDEKLDTAIARDCTYFKIDNQEMESILSNGSDNTFTILKDVSK